MGYGTGIIIPTFYDIFIFCLREFAILADDSHIKEKILQQRRVNGIEGWIGNWLKKLARVTFVPVHFNLLSYLLYFPQSANFYLLSVLLHSTLSCVFNRGRVVQSWNITVFKILINKIILAVSREESSFNLNGLDLAMYSQLISPVYSWSFIERHDWGSNNVRLNVIPSFELALMTSRARRQLKCY